MVEQGEQQFQKRPYKEDNQVSLWRDGDQYTKRH